MRKMGGGSNEGRQSNWVLVFSPHPDDLELSAGLTCDKLKKAGLNIIEVVLTDGAAGAIDKKLFHTKKLVTLRKNEAVRAAKILRINKAIFFGYDDGGLKNNTRNLLKRIRNVISEIKPTLVIFPSAKDMHDDHYYANLVIEKCLRKSFSKIGQLQYCFWGVDNRQNTSISNRQAVYKKMGAIKKHKSQPISKYLARKKFQRDLAYGIEKFYSPNPKHTRKKLKAFGIELKITKGV